MFDLTTHHKPSSASQGGVGGRAWLALALTLALWAGAPAHSALAAPTAAPSAQGVDPACMLNGSPLNPTGSGDVAWAFLANFNHAVSSAASKSCLVVRSGSTITRTAGNYCLVKNNGTGHTFGGGEAAFDGGAYLHCDVPIPAVQTYPEFNIRAQAKWPSSLSTLTYNLVSGNDTAFSVQADPTCLLTLSSRYDTIAFTHTTTKLCGSYALYTSWMRQAVPTNQLPTGRHRINDGSAQYSYGPTPDAGSFDLPASYVFDLGQNSAGLSLDWILMDPGGECCAPK